MFTRKRLSVLSMFALLIVVVLLIGSAGNVLATGTPPPDKTSTDTPIPPTPTKTPVPPTPTNTPVPPTPTNTPKPPTPTPTEPPMGGEGCTPGYWKQPHHFDSWVGYAPGDSFDAIFGVPYDLTLLEALEQGGGHEKALGRHAVAALLNAASGVSYYYSEAQVISLVQSAYATGDFNGAKNQLAAQNEMGCPLN